MLAGDGGRDLPEVKNSFLASIKGPLVFSLVLGLVGGVVAMMTASGAIASTISRVTWLRRRTST